MSAVAEAAPSTTALPTPEGIQEEVVTLKPEGHAVILGTSGSGKSALAVLRALFLSDPAKEHAGRTLLVTYNKSLLRYLNHFIPKDAANVEACTYHRFSKNYLDEKGKTEGAGTVIGKHKLALVKQAREEARSKSTDEILQRPTGFFVDELDWMVQNGYLTEDSYLKSDRAARGEEISDESRKVIFEIQKTYWRLRSEMGKQYDGADMPAATHAALKEDKSERRYRHVVIDEGQDFSAEMLRSLAVAIPKEGGSLTFFGDTAQQIYGHGNNWRTAGLDVSEPLILTKNYRNSAEIAKLADAIAGTPFFKGQPDMVEAAEITDHGPLPELVVLPNRAAEDAFVVERAEALAATGSVAVLCRRDADAARIGEKLANATHLHKELSAWEPKPGILYGNVHSAKGYEFQSVILVGVTNTRWPEPRVVNTIGEAEASAMDSRLLHVAVSRAKKNLVMTATRELTSLLPPNDGLWTEKQEAPPPASPGSSPATSARKPLAISLPESAATTPAAATAPQAGNGSVEQENGSAPAQEASAAAPPAPAENGSAAPGATSDGAATPQPADAGPAEPTPAEPAQADADMPSADAPPPPGENGSAAPGATSDGAAAPQPADAGPAEPTPAEPAPADADSPSADAPPAPGENGPAAPEAASPDAAAPQPADASPAAPAPAEPGPADADSPSADAPPALGEDGLAAPEATFADAAAPQPAEAGPAEPAPADADKASPTEASSAESSGGEATAPGVSEPVAADTATALEPGVAEASDQDKSAAAEKDAEAKVVKRGFFGRKS